MKANKYMIMICLLLLGMSGKVLAQKGNTGDVRIAGKSVRKVDSLLQINLKIDLTGSYREVKSCSRYYSGIVGDGCTDSAFTQVAGHRAYSPYCLSAHAGNGNCRAAGDAPL